MKSYRHLLVAIALLILPACEQKSNNQQNGVKDAMGARPYEKIRDAAEDTGDAFKEAGRDFKDAVNGS